MKLKLIGKDYPWTSPNEIKPNAKMTGLARLAHRADSGSRRRCLYRLLLARLCLTGARSTGRTSSRLATPRGDPRGVPKLLFLRSLPRLFENSFGRLEGFGAKEEYRRLLQAFLSAKMENLEDFYKDDVWTLLLGEEKEPSDITDYELQLDEFLSKEISAILCTETTQSRPNELFDIGNDNLSPLVADNVQYVAEELPCLDPPFISHRQTDTQVAPATTVLRITCPEPVPITEFITPTADSWNVVFDLQPSCDDPWLLTAVPSGAAARDDSIPQTTEGHDLEEQKVNGREQVVDYSKLREDNNRACQKYRKRRKEQEARLEQELELEQERSRRLKARLLTLQGLKDKMQQRIIELFISLPPGHQIAL